MLVLAIMVTAAGGTLNSEALALIERLYSQGYTGTGIYRCSLELLESCTLSVYPPEDSISEGFYAGLGGNNILDLGLRLEGRDWFIEDSMPDDYPVLRLDSLQVSQGVRLIITAQDMIRGARRDSVVVIWAFSPVDRS